MVRIARRHILKEAIMAGMDEIDQQQQRELEALKRVDVKHDRDILLFKVFGTVVVLCTLLMFAVTMETLSNMKELIIHMGLSSVIEGK